MALLDVATFAFGDYLESRDHLIYRVACCGTNNCYALRAFPLHSPSAPAIMTRACLLLKDISTHGSKQSTQNFFEATAAVPLGQAGVVRLVALWSLDIVLEIKQTIDL